MAGAHQRSICFLTPDQRHVKHTCRIGLGVRQNFHRAERLSLTPFVLRSVIPGQLFAGLHPGTRPQRHAPVVDLADMKSALIARGVALPRYRKNRDHRYACRGDWQSGCGIWCGMHVQSGGPVRSSLSASFIGHWSAETHTTDYSPILVITGLQSYPPARFPAYWHWVFGNHSLRHGPDLLRL